MRELNDFYNDGFGWICRRCESDLKESATHDRSRLLREGEGETKLSTNALARWADPAQRTLVCPRCGTFELVDIS